MKTRTVTITNPIDKGESQVTVDPYYEIGDRVIFDGRGAVVVAERGVAILSSADAWAEQLVGISFEDENTGRIKWHNSGDLRPRLPWSLWSEETY